MQNIQNNDIKIEETADTDVIDFTESNKHIKYEDYSKMVEMLANKFIMQNNGFGNYTTEGDLVSEGWIVFNRAIKYFDSSRGIMFSTYFYNALDNRFKRLVTSKLKRNNEVTNYEYIFGCPMEDVVIDNAKDDMSYGVLESECIIHDLSENSKAVFKEIQENPKFYAELSKKQYIKAKASVISSYFNLSNDESMDVLKNLIGSVGGITFHKSVLATSEYLDNYLS